MRVIILRLTLAICCVISSLAIATEVKVEVVGVNEPFKSNILAFLSLQQVQGYANLTPVRIRKLHNQAIEEISNALQPFGYFHPDIKTSLDETAQSFSARYHVDLGPPTRIAKVDFKVHGPGSTDPAFAHRFALKVGDILNQADYESAKQSFLARAIDRGYLDASYLRHEINVNIEQNQAQIFLYLETGIQFKFGEVKFLQNVLDPHFLKRYVRFQSGDVFQNDKLLTLQSNLIDSEYFSQVEIRVQREQAQENQVPVDLVLTPNKPNRYRFGVGFATDSGPRLTTDWDRRRIGNQGVHMNTELRLSAPDSLIKTQYIIPLDKPWQDSLAFSLEFEHLATDARNGNRLDLNASYVIGLGHDWRRTMALDYNYEKFELDNTVTSYQLIPSITWNQISQDQQMFARSGHRLSFQVLGTTRELLSSSNFLQVHTSGKLIRELGKNWRVLTRGEAGASLAASIADIPVSKRFFTGGDNSVRGYAMDQLGPKDASNKVIGGRFLSVGSLELDRHILGNWSCAVFYDVGGAFDPDYTNAVAQGIGFGARWQSPVGPVRVDLASALSIPGNPWRLHIVVGPEL